MEACSALALTVDLRSAYYAPHPSVSQCARGDPAHGLLKRRIGSDILVLAIRIRLGAHQLVPIDCIFFCVTASNRYLLLPIY